MTENQIPTGYLRIKFIKDPDTGQRQFVLQQEWEIHRLWGDSPRLAYEWRDVPTVEEGTPDVE